MHNKQFVLAVFLFLFLFSPLSFGYVTYEDENSYYSDGNQSYESPSQSFDDYNNTSRPYNDSDYYADSYAFSDQPQEEYDQDEPNTYHSSSARLPRRISPPGEKVIIIDPRAHGWGAYSPEGILIRSGLASAGAKWCRDRGRPCRTATGSFRIFSLGNSDCVSSIYPLDEGGGAPMPYCMFFNGNQGLHGSNQLAEGNISHGCVRVSVRDAEWIRYDFAAVGTKVIVLPY